MYNSNNAPFSVGQEIVCIKSAGEGTISVKKNHHYTVGGLYQCPGCGSWGIDIGLPAPDRNVILIVQCSCNSVIARDLYIAPSTLFAPLEKRSITISQSLKKEAEEWMQERVKEIADAPVKVEEQESVPV